MRLKNVFTYCVLGVFALQTNLAVMLSVSTAISVFYTASVLASPPPVYDPDTPLLNELKRKYTIHDPDRNTVISGGTLGTPVSTPPKDLSQIIAERSFSSSTEVELTPNPSIDLSDTSSLLSQYEQEGLAIGLTNGAPVGDADGNIDVKYAKKATRKFEYDEDGRLVIEIIDEEPEYVETGGERESYLSQEVNRDDIEFAADEAHGDDPMIRQEGRTAHSTLSTGTDTSSRAYQALINSASRANNTVVDPNAGWLNPSQQAFDDASTPAGGFFSSCETTVETKRKTINYPTKKEYSCQQNMAQNLNYCEVERKLRIPMVVGGDGFESCGVGCYELTIGKEGDNYYEPPCGKECASQIFTESRIFNLNLADGFRLSQVTASAQFDDHFELLINNNLAFSRYRKQFSYVQRVPVPPANAGRGFAEQGNDSMPLRDVSFGVLRHIDQNANNTYDFTVNTLVGGRGEMLMKIRFYITDETGEGYGEIIKQTPEGCLDKVDPSYQNRDGNTGGGGGGGGVIVPGDEWVNENPTFGIQSQSFSPTQTQTQSQSQTQNNDLGDGSDFGRLDEGEYDYSLCRFDSYVPLEVGDRGYPQEYLDLIGPFYPGDTGNKTWRYELENYRCDPLGGLDYCVVDPETGEEECYTWDELLAQPNQCDILQNDNSCSEVSRQCTPGWDIEVEDESYCFNETVTYSCETNNTIDREVETSTNTCAGAIPCSGGDCEFGETESNDRFVEAAVMGSVIQYADSDRSCEIEDDPSTCRIFEGEYEYCSTEVTGLGMDCCEEAGGVDILAYVTAANLMIKSNKLAKEGIFGDAIQGGVESVADTASTFGESIKGSWTSFKKSAGELGTKAWDAMPKAITQGSETLIGNSTGVVADATGPIAEAFSSTKEAFTGALGSLQQNIYQLAYEALPQELASQLFTQAGGEAVTDAATQELVLNESITNFFSNVMLAYQVYSTIKLALTLLTMCDENESDMGIKLAQRQCFKVGGSYCSKKILGVCIQKRQDHCCYNSILARIIMEQAGPLLGKDMSSCEGLTQEELARLDFDRIDLSEWVGLMIESGEMKSRSNENILTGGGEFVGNRCEQFEVEDPITGIVTTEERCFKKLEGGRMINSYGRQTVSERTSDRMDGASSYTENMRQGARNMANGIDCSASPRPAVCEFGFTIDDGGQ